MGELIDLYEIDDTEGIIIKHTTIDAFIKYLPCTTSFYWYLRKQSTIQDEKIGVSLSVKELETICDKGRNTVKRWIRELKDVGALKITKDKNDKTRNIYEVGYTEKVDNTIIEKYYF